VELVPLGKSYGDLTCFSSGRVDAGFLVEPNVALGESMGLVKILASVKEYFPRYQWGIIFARNDILRDKLDLADRALEAYRESCRSIKENLEAALWFGAQVFRMKKNIFRIALQRDLANWELDARVDLVGLENCLRLQEQAGAIPCGLGERELVCQL
jgi:ABC-type nitrate/sulfonate/bicarbonate transport system substrate-binding protein